MRRRVSFASVTDVRTTVNRRLSIGIRPNIRSVLSEIKRPTRQIAPPLPSDAVTHSDTKQEEFYNLIPSKNTKQHRRLEDYIAARNDSTIIPGELQLPAFLSEFGRTILVPQLPPLPQFSSSPTTQAQGLSRDAGRYRITIDHAEWINFAQYHANVSPIRLAKILNENKLDTERLLFEISILPEEYGHSGKKRFVICHLVKSGKPATSFYRCQPVAYVLSPKQKERAYASS